MQPDNSDDKRKTQNRHAQRAFRDRRAQKVVELETELEEQRQKYRMLEEALRVQKAEIEQQRATIVLKDEQIMQKDEKIESLNRMLKQGQDARPQGVSSPPPSSPLQSYEDEMAH